MDRSISGRCSHRVRIPFAAVGFWRRNCTVVLSDLCLCSPAAGNLFSGGKFLHSAAHLSVPGSYNTVGREHPLVDNSDYHAATGALPIAGYYTVVLRCQQPDRGLGPFSLSLV